MKVNFDQPIFDESDKSYKDLDFKKVAVFSLNNGVDKDKPLTPEETYVRGKLIQEIKAGKEEFTKGELILMKKAAGQAGCWKPFVYIQFCDLLEPKEPENEVAPGNEVAE